MRLVAAVLATLCLLSAAALGLARAKTNFQDARNLDSLGEVAPETVAQAKALGLRQADVLEIDPSALRRGAMGMIASGVLGILLLASVIVKRGVTWTALLLVVAASLTIVLNPQYDTSTSEATSARNVAYVIGALAGFGALFAFAADRFAERRTRRALHA